MSRTVKCGKVKLRTQSCKKVFKSNRDECEGKMTIYSQRMILLVSFLSSLFISILAQGCDESLCPGPIHYYNELGCIAIKKPGDCCPYKYDCVHRKPRKCYINGFEFDEGDVLSNEHSGPCMQCTCQMDSNRVGHFLCSTPSCVYLPEVSAGCHLYRSANTCCSNEIICNGFPYGYSLSWLWSSITSSEYDTVCEVDGITYGGGEFFIPLSEPHKKCYCGSGYTGQNIMPFCYTQRGRCGIEMHEAHTIFHNCAPIYENSDSDHYSCPSGFLCQDGGEQTIRNFITYGGTYSNSNTDLTCKFGNMTLSVGEELKEGTFRDSKCIECVCQVPPVLTCKRLSSKTCHMW